MSSDRVLVMTCSFIVAIGLTVVGALGLAAWSFRTATTIWLPFVATFHGFTEDEGSHAVTIDASWLGVVALVLVLATPLVAAATAYRSRGRE